MYEPDQPRNTDGDGKVWCVCMSDTVWCVCFMFCVVPTQGAFTCVCFVCVLCPCIRVYVPQV